MTFSMSIYCGVYNNVFVCPDGVLLIYILLEKLLDVVFT